MNETLIPKAGEGEAGFARHIAACNNAELPGERVPFRIGAEQVGWVLPSLAASMADAQGIEIGPDGATLTDPTALHGLTRMLAERGMLRIRQEEFDVRSRPDGPVLAQIDRGALPKFGIQAVGVHVNGLVDKPGGPYLWVARRARDKQLDPGKLDHVVAGGVPAGLGPSQTLIKEAGEEAAIPPALAAQARFVGQIAYAMIRPEGLRRDLLHCFDLTLPDDFRPTPADGEVEAFELWPMAQVVDTVRQSDAFKFNVNLVLIDLFIRLGLLEKAEADRLSKALKA